jgi:ATP-dependent helicase YprA (DUF1998 family)
MLGPTCAAYSSSDSQILFQHFLRNPKELFGLPAESNPLGLSNHQILLPHLLCAAAEVLLDDLQ